MDKRKVIAQIQSYLAQEFLEPADGREKPDAGEIQRLLLMYRFLPVRDQADEKDALACPGSLVELDLNGVRAHYLIVPSGGGLVTSVDGQAVQVITPQSPLGASLLGKRVGDEVSVELSGKRRCYKVVGIS